jgi:hypothetical protein
MTDKCASKLSNDLSKEQALARETKRQAMARLKETALAALERRGYQVRGKTTTQIREVLRHQPTGPKAVG